MFRNLFQKPTPPVVAAPVVKGRSSIPSKYMDYVKLAALVLLAAIAIKYAMSMNSSAVIIQGYPVTAAPLRRPMVTQPTASKPISTPTMLGSKHGLGGGPLVGSQSIRLGGSAFLPGRSVDFSDNQFQERRPTQLVRSAPPAAPVAAPVADPIVVVPASVATTSVPARKRKRFFFFGAPPTPYQTQDGMIVDTRDGQVIQPRI